MEIAFNHTCKGLHDCTSFNMHATCIKTVFLYKIYGAAVTFFEVLSEDQLTEERKQALQLNSDNVREVKDYIIDVNLLLKGHDSVDTHVLKLILLSIYLRLLLKLISIIVMGNF